MDVRNPSKSTDYIKRNNMIVKTGIMATLAVLSYARLTKDFNSTQSSSPKTFKTASGKLENAKTVYTGTHFNKYIKTAGLANSNRN
jgi:hypothetical protein